MIPLTALAELAAHEEQLLARMRVEIREEQAQIGELLPQVAGHFVKERAFSVDDFIVGEGEDEIFGEGVEHRESDFVVLVFAVDGIERKIL